MKRHLVLVVLAGALASCGDDGPSTPESQATTTVSQESGLVTETRPITTDEAASLSSDDGHDPLPCPRYGTAQWDWGPISSDAETGRRPVDALADAIADLGSEPSSDVLLVKGWVELVVDDEHRIFVLDGRDGFGAAVMVAGDPERGIWRHNKAFVCPDVVT